MSKYSGLSCPVCEKPFEDKDDIVVCPDCGAPYHRVCYVKEGNCIFQDLHDNGQLWKPVSSSEHTSIGPETNENGELICPRCAAANLPDNEFCQICGWNLSDTAGYNDSSLDAGTDYRPNTNTYTQEDFERFFRSDIDFSAELKDGVTYKEAGCFVGKSSLNFLSKFKGIVEGPKFGKKVLAFNIPAFFFSFMYFFYRKMYKIGCIMLVLLLLAFIPYQLYSVKYIVDVINVYGIEQIMTFPVTLPVMEGSQTLNILSFVFQSVSMLLMVFSGFMFDKLYCKHTIASVKRIKADSRCSTGSDELNANIARSGGTAFLPVVLCIAAYIAICFISAYYMLQ